MKSIKAVETSFYAKRGSGKAIIILFCHSFLIIVFIAVNKAMSVNNICVSIICVSISLIRLRVLFTTISQPFSFPTYKGRHVCRAGFSRHRRCAAR